MPHRQFADPQQLGRIRQPAPALGRQFRQRQGEGTDAGRQIKPFGRRTAMARHRFRECAAMGNGIFAPLHL